MTGQSVVNEHIRAGTLISARQVIACYEPNDPWHDPDEFEREVIQAVINYVINRGKK